MNRLQQPLRFFNFFVHNCKARLLVLRTNYKLHIYTSTGTGFYQTRCNIKVHMLGGATS